VNAIIPENEGHPEPGRLTDHCVACGRLAVELADAQHAMAGATWSLIDALIWGGRTLDDPHTDRDEAAAVVAEGLLDRIGQVLSRMTGKGVGVGPDGSVTLSDVTGPVTTTRVAGVVPEVRDTDGRLVVPATVCVVCGFRQRPGGMTANPARPGVCAVCDLRCSDALDGPEHRCPVCAPEARRYAHEPAGGESE
jgi:hypothetical protein